MNKYYLLAIALLGVLYINAQDLAYKIPKEANVVASVKGKNLTDLYEIQDFDKNRMGKEILKEFARKGNAKSVADLGIDISSTGYYFYQMTDSVRYHCTLMPINDVQKFEKLINPNKVKKIEGLNVVYKDYNRTFVMAWNNEMFLSVKGEISNSFFEKDEIKKRYKLPVKQEDELNKYLSSDIKRIFGNEDIKEAITFQYILNKIDKILNTPIGNKESILSNRKYLKTLDKKAEASIWVSDFMKMYSDIVMDRSFGRFSNLFYKGGMNPEKIGYQEFTGHIYTEKDEVKVKATYHMDREMASNMKKMYKNSLNSKFLKYVNEEELLGYVSYVINTEGFLKEYPKMMKTNLGGYFETEADLIVDLLEVALDEKAISKVIKGDALFLLYDVADKEVTYKTYTYGDDFERKEVEKTRTETIPDFLLLLSSDDTALLQKVLKYGEKKEKVSYTNGIYTIADIDFPTELYLKIDKGIISLGTSLSRVQNGSIASQKISAKHRKILKNSSASIFVNTKEVLEITKGFQRSKRKKKRLDYILNNVEDIQLTTSKVKNNKMTAELKMKVPQGHKNGLEYLINLIEKLD